MSNTVDIISLVQSNVLSKLSSNYGSKIIERIKDRFKDEDQLMFIANFYCYLNYDTKKDFVVELSKVWKWLGYGRIEECKRCLTKNFKENIDYKIAKAAPQDGGTGTIDKNVISHSEQAPKEGKNLGGAGLNKEYITLTINCFKKLCLKSKTEKADQIHDYYVNLEDIINEIAAEQSEELKLQLKDIHNKMNDNIQRSEEILIANNIDKKVLYIGQVEEDEHKFGISRYLDTRVLKNHKKDFNQFTLKYVICTEKYVELEELIKKECKEESSPLYNRRITKTYNGKTQTEILKVDDNFTIDDVYKYILVLKDKCENDDIVKMRKEIVRLRKIIYNIDPSLLKEKKEPEQETIRETEQDQGQDAVEIDQGIEEAHINLKKCTSCGNIEETDINNVTGQHYSSCNKCRKKASDLTYQKSEEQRRKKDEEYQLKIESIQKMRSELLNSNISVRCFVCKETKTPKEMDINKLTNELYKTCTSCRSKKEDPNKEPDIDHSKQIECSKCHQYFDRKYNEITKSDYKTCESCREKDSLNRKGKKESVKDLTGTLECNTCHKEMPKELNAHKDGFYLNCKECRESRKKHDKKKNEVHKEEISESKKVYYQEHKEEIRAKQKEYYDKTH
jgi:hypothetical protein